MTTATIVEKSIRVGKEPLVILPLKEYQKLCKKTASTYHLRGTAASGIDKLVKEGMKEYHSGKCKIIKSLSDLD